MSPWMQGCSGFHAHSATVFLHRVQDPCSARNDFFLWFRGHVNRANSVVSSLCFLKSSLDVRENTYALCCEHMGHVKEKE